MEIPFRIIAGALTYLAMSVVIAPLWLLLVIIFWLFFLSNWFIGRKSRPPRRVLILAVLGPILLTLLIPIPFYTYAHMVYHKSNQSHSPDHEYTLLLESRPDFPMSEMVDPISDVRIVLIDTHSGKVIRIDSLTVEEDSDACQSKIDWKEDRVTIDFGRNVIRELILTGEPAGGAYGSPAAGEPSAHP